MLLGASSATSIQQFKDAAPETPKCTNANKATTDDQDCSTAGNSAWNTITTSRTAKPKDAQASPYPDHTEHIQLDSEDIVGTGFKGALDFKVTPAVNACTNANKATTDDESCSADGNSAWNTITTSRTAKPKDAMSGEYPGHAEHLQIDSQFDGGSHIDTYPPYVPTNNAYPKIYDARAKTAPAVETQTPPADTAAPQAPGWYKPAWYKSGSSTSFGNLLQLDAETEDIVGTGFKGALDFKVTPAVNACTNANKATTDDENCSADGNSAWNTITTSRTAKPKDAMSGPYPGHALH